MSSEATFPKAAFETSRYGDYTMGVDAQMEPRQDCNNLVKNPAFIGAGTQNRADGFTLSTTTMSRRLPPQTTLPPIQRNLYRIKIL